MYQSSKICLFKKGMKRIYCLAPNLEENVDLAPFLYMPVMPVNIVCMIIWAYNYRFYICNPQYTNKNGTGRMVHTIMVYKGKFMGGEPTNKNRVAMCPGKLGLSWFGEIRFIYRQV